MWKHLSHQVPKHKPLTTTFLYPIPYCLLFIGFWDGGPIKTLNGVLPNSILAKCLSLGSFRVWITFGSQNNTVTHYVFVASLSHPHLVYIVNCSYYFIVKNSEFYFVSLQARSEIKFHTHTILSKEWRSDRAELK